MRVHNLTKWLLALAVPAGVWGAAGVRAGPAGVGAVPRISGSQRAFLSRLARRTVRDVALGRAPYEPGYVPGALSRLSAEVIVRLRERGFLLATAGGGPAPIAASTRDAALTAARHLSQELVFDVELADGLLIEIEVIGAAEPISVEGDWTQPRAVGRYVEPGVHGIALVGGRTPLRFCPTELFTNDLVLADALTQWAQATHAGREQLDEVRLMRFRTLHWYQASAGADIVSLQRGLVPVAESAVSASGLDGATERLAAYMMYRQLASGRFSYQYEPAKDRYSPGDNVVRQAGAAAAMSYLAAATGKSAARSAADLAIRFHLQGVTELLPDEEAAFIATADGLNKLGVTALVCVAMAVHPQADRYASERERLVRGMLRLQQPSGMFVTAFPPAVRLSAQDYFPGEAMLALATHYARSPSAQILDAFDRAVSFYRQYFRHNPSPAFVPWQVQAYALMARHTKRQDYAAYVFELTDWLAGMQLSEDNCPWRELWGGIDAYGGGRAGVSTAAYLEGFADALALARWKGDEARTRRYEKVVRGAARFVLQLQIKPEEAYFIRSPRDAIGGIRTAPWLDLIRIDHCQHALVGLLKARAALFPSED